ncbi:uncharacterized protein LOC142351180 isoform X2 [Convolutriloba macropyga]|uniref:uncharacterized protein LOC142351180 isoform X2 n=1 Tax=Convolutriloba macropyga TaxID=536237 RepID=UPI003F51E525
MSDESIDHVNSRRFLDIPRARKNRNGNSDQISSLFGTVPYGDFLENDETNLDSLSKQRSKSGGNNELSFDYEEDLKSPKSRDNLLEEVKQKELDLLANTLRSQQELLPSESSSVDGGTPVSSQTRDSLEREESVNNLRTTGVSTADLVGDACDDNESKRSFDDDSIDIVRSATAVPFTAEKGVQPTEHEYQQTDRSEPAGSISSPMRTSVRVRRPPGGECSDIFNIGQNSTDQKSTSSSIRPSISLNSFRHLQTRIPWGTDDDLKKVPSQKIPPEPQARPKPSNDRHPYLGKTDSTQKKEPSDQKKDTKVSAPFGTDLNFTAM